MKCALVMPDADDQLPWRDEVYDDVDFDDDFDDDFEEETEEEPEELEAADTGDFTSPPHRPAEDKGGAVDEAS